MPRAKKAKLSHCKSINLCIKQVEPRLTRSKKMDSVKMAVANVNKTGKNENNNRKRSIDSDLEVDDEIRFRTRSAKQRRAILSSNKSLKSVTENKDNSVVSDSEDVDQSSEVPGPDGVRIHVEGSDFDSESEYEEEEGELQDFSDEEEPDHTPQKTPLSKGKKVNISRKSSVKTDDLLDRLLQKKLEEMPAEELAALMREKGISGLPSNPKETVGNAAARPTPPAVKSPSESTLYRPIFSHRMQPRNIMPGEDDQSEKSKRTPPPTTPVVSRQPGNQLPDIGSPTIIDRISQFVESIRMEREPAPGPSGERPKVRSEIHVPEVDSMKERAKNSTLTSEKFKATIEPPKRRMSGDSYIFNNEPSVLTDDDFFHLTCHIDVSVKEKMERGEFVDLEKLLPKGGNAQVQDRLEWIHKDGSTFLAPVSQRDNKISSVRKWDQAFRIYATFYSGANPHRSKEIWQYVDVIHTAAASYSWDNVYNYDVTFCHLMKFNCQ